MKLDSQIKERLQRCSKDEISQSKLEELFGQIILQYEEVANQLNMLERAISHDYDSILITELCLENPGPIIVYVNDGFTRMTGYSKAEVLGKSPRILQGPKTDRKVLDRLRKGLTEGQGFFGHTVNYRKDGSEFINQWDIHPLLNEYGEITHWVSYQRDITERENINKMLLEATAEFDRLEEDLKRTCLEIDTHGNIIDSNRSFREVLGYTVDELATSKIWDLATENNKVEIKHVCTSIGNTSNFEHKYIWEFSTKGDDSILFEASFKTVIVKNETRIKISFENITLRNKLIEALKKKTLNLEEALNKCEEFTLKFKKTGNKYHCYYASNNFKRITGYTISKVMDDGVDIMLDEESNASFYNHLDKAFKGELTTAKCICRKDDGSALPVMQAFRPIWDNSKTEVIAVKSVAILDLEKNSKN